MQFVNPFIRIFLSRLNLGALLLGFAASVSMFASDREKYLAAAGPTPIRLLAEAPRLDPMKALPRLRMFDAEQVKVAERPQVPVKEQAVNPVAVPTDGSSINIEIAPNQPLPPMTNNESEPKQEPAAQLSPQMLLRYFTRGGTNEVLVPYTVDFTPPMPRQNGDSKAVYISQ